MSDRTLISIKRDVPAPRREEYARLWARLEAEAAERGMHAWRFAAADLDGLFVEFLEARDGSDPGELRALRALDDALGGGQLERWREVREPGA